MTESIDSILGAKRFSEPDEIGLIKDFVQKNFGITPAVAIRPDSFIIAVPNAAVGGALRFRLNELKTQLKTEKRLVIRIGS
jgi:hypothetical protein